MVQFKHFIIKIETSFSVERVQHSKLKAVSAPDELIPLKDFPRIYCQSLFSSARLQTLMLNSYF